MTIRKTLTALFFGLIASGSASAEPLSLDQISAYLNALETAQTRFIQYDSTGSSITGTLYIHRPGRMRFEYDAPNDALVLASANTVAIFDEKSNAPPQQFPLKRTPLNLLLARTVDLSSAAMVSGHRETENGDTLILARDPENPESGTLELIFAPDPIALRQWVVTDEVGGRTAVVLEPLKTGEVYGQSLFSIILEKSRRGF